MARPRSHSGVLFPKLYFDVEPDEEEIRTDLLLLERKMGDYDLPLQHSKQIIIGDVNEAFLKEKDPLGTTWQRLSDRAAKVPRDGILRRRQTNARMYRAMINRYNYGVNKQGVYLNQSRIPEYFVYHQQDAEGTGGTKVVKVNKAQFLRDVAEEKLRLGKTRIYEGKHNRGQLIEQEAAKNIADKYKSKVEGLYGAGGKVPQRRFLGPSKPAQDKMVETFDDWAKDVIIIYKRGKNVISRSRPGLK